MNANGHWVGTTSNQRAVCKCTHKITLAAALHATITVTDARSSFKNLYVQTCNTLGCSLGFSKTTQCANVDCTASNTMYCFASSDTCTAQTAPKCTSVHGSTLNSISCMCGNKECTASTGMYCVAEKDVCYKFKLCDTGMYLLMGSCVDMTQKICPDGKGYSSATASMTFSAEYAYVSDTKCQADDGSDWDQWYKTSTFTAKECKQWCTDAGAGCVAYGIGIRSDLLSGCIVYMKNGIDPSSKSPNSDVICATQCSGTAVDQAVVSKVSDPNWECNKKLLHTVVKSVGATENDGKCTSCEPGFYKSTLSTFCQLCPIGYSNKQNAASSCSACSAGFYIGVAGRSECIPCRAGLFGDATKQISSDDCKTCGSGKYAGVSGSSSCSICPAGTFLKDTTGAIDLHDERLDCKDCAAAKYNPFEGHGSECFECISAKAAATTECEGCAPGKFKVKVSLAESRCCKYFNLSYITTIFRASESI